MIRARLEGTKPAYAIRPLETSCEYDACARLQYTVWGRNFSEALPASMFKVARRFGGVVLGAFDASGEICGFVFGFTGWQEGEPVHWSDMLAVREEHRGQDLGRKLKLRQREVLLNQRIEHMSWSYDPLESRNAYLNFAKLGVTAREYVPEMYGETGSLLHEGIGTDRLIVLWDLASARVEERTRATAAPVSLTHIADVPRANQIGWIESVPVSSTPELDLDAPRLLITIPGNIQELRSTALTTAREWRQHTRAAFQHYLARGYEVREVVREGPFSHYLLVSVDRADGTNKALR